VKAIPGGALIERRTASPPNILGYSKGFFSFLSENGDSSFKTAIEFDFDSQIERHFVRADARASELANLFCNPGRLTRDVFANVTIK
jgi:hypothetical protein